MEQKTGPVPVIPGDQGFAIYRAAEQLLEDVVDLTVAISEVPAPTDDEMTRAYAVADHMRGLGFAHIQIDSIGNVTGRITGRQPGTPVAIAAHIDTVFDRSTDLAVRRTKGRIAGPGVGDNSLGVAASLYLHRVFELAGVQPAVDLIVTGNVGEEGLGNLRGIRAVLDSNPEVAAVIAVEGHNLGRVTNVAVGSKRYRVSVVGPGGHSWGDFGRANAIQVAAQMVGELTSIRLPDAPKTTLSVGTITGGTSVNTIAPTCEFLLDLRSIDAEMLETLADQVEGVLERSRKDVAVSYDILGVRPAGRVSQDSPLIRIASTVLESLGISPIADASSTDANIPISRGIPSVCIGLTSGGNVHRVDEYIDTAPIVDGLYQLAITAFAIAEQVADGHDGTAPSSSASILSSNSR